MRRIKDIRGITLIALVITIIVMLILVGVTLNVVLNNGLMENAQTARDRQEVERDREQLYTIAVGTIGEDGRVNFEKLNTRASAMGFEGSNGTYTKNERTFYVDSRGNVTVEGEPRYAEELSLGPNTELMKEEDLTGDIAQAVRDGKVTAVIKEGNLIAPVPAGFTVSSTEGENTILGGLVIKDRSGNEFVWIPVPEISDMTELQDGSPSNYRGVLYNWAQDSTGKSPFLGTLTLTWREPANLTYTTEINGESVAYDSQEAFTEYGGGTYTETMYQTEFNSMVESVGKYKGFYVGRYETGGFNTDKIVVKPGETGTYSSNSSDNSINYVNWYKAYKMQKDFASGSTSVASTMIWGCQWDQVMKFVDDKEDGAGKTYDVTAYRPERHTGNLAATGSNINDKVQNIYDLEGNIFEWTLEAGSVSGRVESGGYYNYDDYAAIHGYSSPIESDFTLGSRAILYIR